MLVRTVFACTVCILVACCTVCLPPSAEGDKNMLRPTSATLATTSKKRLPVKAVKDWREGIEVRTLQAAATHCIADRLTHICTCTMWYTEKAAVRM